MKVEYHKSWSNQLQRDMEYKVYGHDGMTILAFPCQDKRFWDWEDNGMIDALSGFLEAGQIRIVCVDGLDWETWSDKGNWDKEWRIGQHERWFQYIKNELLPLVRRFDGEQFLTCGCSMGGYHAGNFFFRFPQLCSGMISISGLFNGSYGFDDYMSPLVYENSPQDYLQNMPEDHPLMEEYRNKKKIIFSVGQGAWEDNLLWSTREMDRILCEKHVPAWFQYWGYEVNHDWPWWHQHLPWFIGKLVRG